MSEEKVETIYDSAPEFIDEDNRRFRTNNPVSREQMHNKHAALLPAHIVKGKTVLDLGCCLGATGYWCLQNGATHYTGIEFQEGYASLAQKLLGKYHPGKFTIHQVAIEEWLFQPDLPKFDVVCILGVIYGFEDYFSVLKRLASITNNTIAVEGLYPPSLNTNSDFRGVEFINEQLMNLASENSSIHGRGTRITPSGLEWLMRGFGFVSYDSVIKPLPIKESLDTYNRAVEVPARITGLRYMMRFARTQLKTQSVSDDLRSGKGTKEAW